MSFDKPNYYESEQRERNERELRLKDAHKHLATKTEGNVIRCKCGAVMGFVRDPKKVAKA